MSPEDLANAIKELRGQRTQREVSALAGIDPGTWNAYEAAARLPRRGRLRLVAKGLGVSLETLQEVISNHALLRVGQVRLNPPNSREIEALLTRFEDLMRDTKSLLFQFLGSRQT